MRAEHIISALIADIDGKIKHQLDEILHHPRFQQLEASWRGLYYLAGQIAKEKGQACKLKVLSISWQEMGRDLLRAIEFDQSLIFDKIYNQEFGHPGGEPFGILLGDYSIKHNSESDRASDIQVLSEMAKVAAAAFAPFVASADPSLFGLDTFDDLNRPINLQRTFQQKQYLPWNKLRQSEDSRFIALVLPKVLMRLPYQGNWVTTYPFYYEEAIGPHTLNYLWGNPVYCYGAVVARAFQQTGWFTDIKGIQKDKLTGGIVTNLPRIHSDTQASFSTDRCVTDSLEKTLSDFGFIALCELKYTRFAGFYSCNTIQQPKEYSLETATENARLTAMMNYVLCISRFSHYLKVIARDKMGTFIHLEECEGFLQCWLQQYCGNRDNLGVEHRSKYPLRTAKIKVHEQPGKSGSYLCTAYLQPHLQFEQAEMHLKLVTELPRRG